MTDEQKQRLQDESEDAALKLLMNEYAEIEGEALWREFLAAEAAGKDQNTPQREDRESSRRSGKRNRHIDFLTGVGNGCKRAAILFLVLVCLLSPLVMSVEAFKIPVLNYFVAIEKKFSEFNFGENEDLLDDQKALIDLIITAKRPEEYFISKYEVTSTGKIRIYFTFEGRNAMKLSVYPSEGQLNIDTEDVDQTPMKLHSYEAVYLEKEGRRLMWIDAERELIFDLRAFELGEDAFWTYAYSLTAVLSQ